MATTALSTLIPLVRVRRCPDNLILQELRNANRAFCNDTEIWREDLATITTVADQKEYTLTPAHTNTFIKRVTLVNVDAADLYEYEWSVSGDNVLTLEAAPIESGLDIIVSVVYVPTEASTTTQDWIADRYGMAIAKGAEARLKEDPISETDPVPWFDRMGADRAQDKYDDGVANAKSELLQGRQSGDVPVEYPGFFL